jgi:hypothetical protein
VFYSAAMLSLGFPNAISLGLLGGVLEFVLVAGWMSSAAVISTLGILTHSSEGRDICSTGETDLRQMTRITTIKGMER